MWTGFAKWTGRTVLTVAAVAALALAGCSSGKKATTTPSGGTSSPAVTGNITVLAASSLTGTFTKLGQEFEAAHPGTKVTFSFGASSTLAQQIVQGAPADVFASADTTNMDRLEGDGFTTGSPSTFAHNALEIVVGPGNPKNIESLADLAKPGVIYITEGATVPAGKYSLQALQKAGVKVTPKSEETDVKSVISKIELGEADAGIVYTTDVKAAGAKVAGVQIPDQYNVVASYPITVVKGTRESDAANAFIAFVLSPSGQSILASYGFQAA
jgi:molybdate transport system substrate-binding protein